MSLIWLDATGLIGQSVYLAHEHGNWGPEHANSDCLQHPLQLDENRFTIDGSFLVLDEEFKIVVPGMSTEAILSAYGQRQDNGSHVGLRLDYDESNKNFWLLANSHDVVRLGQWNQNNIYHP